MAKLFNKWNETTIQDLIQEGVQSEVFDMIGINDFENGNGVVIIVASGEKAALLHEKADEIRNGEEDYD